MLSPPESILQVYFIRSKGALPFESTCPRTLLFWASSTIILADWSKHCTRLNVGTGFWVYRRNWIAYSQAGFPSVDVVRYCPCLNTRSFVKVPSCSSTYLAYSYGLVLARLIQLTIAVARLSHWLKYLGLNIIPLQGGATPTLGWSSYDSGIVGSILAQSSSTERITLVQQYRVNVVLRMFPFSTYLVSVNTGYFDAGSQLQISLVLLSTPVLGSLRVSTRIGVSGWSTALERGSGAFTPTIPPLMMPCANATSNRSRRPSM